MTSDIILENLSVSIGVNNLNDMQQVTLTTARSECGDIMLYSPTGSGKTLAFLLPCIEMINEVQEEIYDNSFNGGIHPIDRLFRFYIL